MISTLRNRALRRLAWAEARRQPIRTLAATIILAVPLTVLSLYGLSTVAVQRTEARAEQKISHIGGHFEIRGHDSHDARPPFPQRLADVASDVFDSDDDWLVERTSGGTVVVDGLFRRATVTNRDLGHPLVTPTIESFDGRPPEATGEVAVERALGVAVGDVIERPSGAVAEVVGVFRASNDLTFDDQVDRHPLVVVWVGETEDSTPSSFDDVLITRATADSDATALALADAYRARGYDGRLSNGGATVIAFTAGNLVTFLALSLSTALLPVLLGSVVAAMMFSVGGGTFRRSLAMAGFQGAGPRQIRAIAAGAGLVSGAAAGLATATTSYIAVRGGWFGPSDELAPIDHVALTVPLLLGLVGGHLTGRMAAAKLSGQSPVDLIDPPGLTSDPKPTSERVGRGGVVAALLVAMVLGGYTGSPFLLLVSIIGLVYFIGPPVTTFVTKRLRDQVPSTARIAMTELWSNPARPRAAVVVMGIAFSFVVVASIAPIETANAKTVHGRVSETLIATDSEDSQAQLAEIRPAAEILKLSEAKSERFGTTHVSTEPASSGVIVVVEGSQVERLPIPAAARRDLVDNGIIALGEPLIRVDRRIPIVGALADAPVHRVVVTDDASDLPAAMITRAKAGEIGYGDGDDEIWIAPIDPDLASSFNHSEIIRPAPVANPFDRGWIGVVIGIVIAGLVLVLSAAESRRERLVQRLIGATKRHRATMNGWAAGLLTADGMLIGTVTAALLLLGLDSYSFSTRALAVGAALLVGVPILVGSVAAAVTLAVPDRARLSRDSIQDLIVALS